MSSTKKLFLPKNYLTKLVENSLLSNQLVDLTYLREFLFTWSEEY